MKTFYKSKTFWTGLATIIGGLGAYFTGEQELQEILIVIMGGVFTLLRFNTKTSLGFKK